MHSHDLRSLAFRETDAIENNDLRGLVPKIPTTLRSVSEFLMYRRPTVHDPGLSLATTQETLRVFDSHSGGHRSFDRSRNPKFIHRDFGSSCMHSEPSSNPAEIGGSTGLPISTVLPLRFRMV